MLILFSLTLLCDYFIFAYPAVRLFYFHLPCCEFILFSLTLLCVYFIFTYPAVTLFFALPCCSPYPYFFCALTLLCPYPAATCKTFSAPCALLTTRITLAHRLRRRGVITRRAGRGESRGEWPLRLASTPAIPLATRPNNGPLPFTMGIFYRIWKGPAGPR